MAEKCDRQADRDDLAQEARLALWTASATYDPDRTPATKWAAAIVRRVVGFKLADEGRRVNGHSTTSLGVVCADGFGDYGEFQRDPADHRAAAGLDPLAEAVGDFRRSAAALAADAPLATLPPKLRRLAELACVDGLTAPEIAARLGQRLNIVRRNLQVVIAKLKAAGAVTPAVMEEAGVTEAELANCKPACRTEGSPADLAARRELVAEAGAGPTTRELAGLLGVSEQVVCADRRRARERTTKAAA